MVGLTKQCQQRDHCCQLVAYRVTELPLLLVRPFAAGQMTLCARFALQQYIQPITQACTAATHLAGYNRPNTASSLLFNGTALSMHLPDLPFTADKQGVQDFNICLNGAVQPYTKQMQHICQTSRSHIN